MGNPRFAFPFTERQLKANALVPKCASVPSLIGSLFIIQHVLKSKKRRSRVYHRILLMMSVHDLIFSFKNFASTWPIPKSSFIYGSSGTMATCTAAGFLGHGSGLSSICYNFSLTMFFLLVVRYGWREQRIRKYEALLHTIPISIGWSTAVAGIPLKLYNPLGWTCWINTFPPGCIDNETCLRGDNAGIYRWAFYHAELWAVFAFTIVAMFMIYQSVLKQERSLDRYNFRQSVNGVASGRVNGLSRFGRTGSTLLTFGQGGGSQYKLSNDNNRSRSTKFAHQAMLYVIVFFFTWFFPMLQVIFAMKHDTLYFPLNFLSALLTSFQGFSNAVIYLRPRWKRYRKQYPAASSVEVLKRAVMGGELSYTSKRRVVDGQVSATSKAGSHAPNGNENCQEKTSVAHHVPTEQCTSNALGSAYRGTDKTSRMDSLEGGAHFGSSEAYMMQDQTGRTGGSDDVTHEDFSQSLENSKDAVANEQTTGGGDNNDESDDSFEYLD